VLLVSTLREPIFPLARGRGFGSSSTSEPDGPLTVGGQGRKVPLLAG